MRSNPIVCPTRCFGSSPSRSSSLASPISLEEVERQHIERVLAESSTLEEAAAILGINTSTLWRKRKRYRLDERLS